MKVEELKNKIVEIDSYFNNKEFSKNQDNSVSDEVKKIVDVSSKILDLLNQILLMEQEDRKDLGNMESVEKLIKTWRDLKENDFDEEKLKKVSKNLDIILIEINTWRNNLDKFKQVYLSSNEQRKIIIRIVFIVILFITLLIFTICQILEYANVINSNGMIGIIIGSVDFAMTIIFGIYELLDDIYSKKVKQN